MQPCGSAEGDKVGLEVDVQLKLGLLLPDFVSSSLQKTNCSHSCIAVGCIDIKQYNIAI